MTQNKDIKQEYGRKIPLETDDGNIVKVLEKNSNTGNWEVQFYKVNANNTSLNSEDIDLPRRSDVLISDYDGYDNIDSDGEEQYEYDYRAKNSSVVEDLGKLPLTLNPKKLSDEPNQLNEISNNMNSSGRNKRDGSYNVEELEQSDVLISDYDGYDNIDSDGEEQYEYDYRAKNSSVVEDLGKLPLTLNPKKLSDEPNQLNEISNNMNSSGRNKRDGSYNVEELEQLNNSYEKMKESNSSVLSEIKDITQNNTENNNGTNSNVNYLDDFLKLTDKVRKYYDEKKETIRTK
ncbi:TBC1 domain family member 5 homolog A-like [Diaphorina citri]|uniref:TBC1 domain family member 5 homolog A-like n=1 Tax=Diaphorina citri TaxID=121845 RepID=A0A1S4E8F5_DIACI|nr:TBC1 domain family member 5 homolog A-like [Diaphorina citri]